MMLDRDAAGEVTHECFGQPTDSSDRRGSAIEPTGAVRVRRDERRDTADDRPASALACTLEAADVDGVASPRQGLARVKQAIAEGPTLRARFGGAQRHRARGAYRRRRPPVAAAPRGRRPRVGRRRLCRRCRVVDRPGRRRANVAGAAVLSCLGLGGPGGPPLAGPAAGASPGTGSDLDRATTDLAATRRALDRAREEVDRAARAKNEFVSNISHEIRTPMNAILGFSGLLLKEPLSADQREKVGYVHEAGQSLLRLMNHLLDFSRLVTGDRQVARGPVPIRRSDPRRGRRGLPAARAKGLSLRCHVEEAVPAWLRGDKTRLRQVLLNLLDNAVKFTEQGSIHLSATMDEETDDAATLRVTVTDTGVGIPANLHDLVFDGFSQADGSTTRSFEGRRRGPGHLETPGGDDGRTDRVAEHRPRRQHVLVHRHARETRLRRRHAADDAPTDGPRLRKPRDPTRRSPSAAATPASARRRRRPVPPNADRRHARARRLRGRSRGQRPGGPGRAAATNVYDLVFMDVRLPEMDGLETIRHVRRREIATGGHVPIVAHRGRDAPATDRRVMF